MAMGIDDCVVDVDDVAIVKIFVNGVIGGFAVAVAVVVVVAVVVAVVVVIGDGGAGFNSGLGRGVANLGGGVNTVEFVTGDVVFDDDDVDDVDIDDVVVLVVGTFVTFGDEDVVTVFGIGVSLSELFFKSLALKPGFIGDFAVEVWIKFSTKKIE